MSKVDPFLSAARLAICLSLLIAVEIRAQTPTPVLLEIRMLPTNEVSDSTVCQFVVTVQASAALPPAKVVLRKIEGLDVQPASIDIKGGLARFESTGTISRKKGTARPRVGEHRLVAELTSLDGTRPFYVQQSMAVLYRDWITVPCYLAVALLGVVLGYVIRFFVNILKSLPAPSPEPAAGEGPITIWVKAHYYQVDFLVTLAIAFVILVGLIKESRPPDTGATWYAALALGTALGVLTNSELLTRLR